jgi:hypothetical protein
MLRTSHFLRNVTPDLRPAALKITPPLLASHHQLPTKNWHQQEDLDEQVSRLFRFFTHSREFDRGVELAIEKMEQKPPLKGGREEALRHRGKS